MAEQTDVSAFTDALRADVVIPLGPKGRALSMPEALSLRDWWDRRRRRGFTDSGVRYCTAHHGIANEDQDACDFSVDFPGPCEFTALLYEDR